MSIILEDLQSLANGAVDIGAPFDVNYRISRYPVGTGSGAGTITLAMRADGYSISPSSVAVAIASGEDTANGTFKVSIQGPSVAAAVRVTGFAAEVHSFFQDVQ